MLINKIDLVMPYFVIEGKRKIEPIISMPGIARFSIDNLLKNISELGKLGIKKVLLFGVCSPKYKDEKAGYAYSRNNIISQAVKAIKQELRDIAVITDVCLCAYTLHGHCGIVGKADKKIQSKATLDALSRMALIHAQAGADWVAPSAMAKNQVLTIRRVLDKNGFKKTKILGYSAKFASNFYGPFRDAADSAPKFADRRAYQLDYSDVRQALSEIEDDIKEGADAIMVKPALSYLDIISRAKQKFNKPLVVPGHIGVASTPLLAAYNVSGEYAFVKYGAKQGWWDEKKMVAEVISSIKRAGADWIITYHAKDIAGWLKEN